MTRRILALALLALAVQPAVASAAWVGGDAPRNIALGELVAEADGTLVALDGLNVSASVGGSALVRQPARGLPADSLLLDLQVVAGGIVQTVGSELFASTDHGATWTRKGDLGDVFGNESSQSEIVSWAIDPEQPDHLVRIHRDGAIQRSLDGGATWLSAFPLGRVDGSPIADGSVVFSAGAIYAVLDGKGWRSDDLATTWQPLADAPDGQLVVIPGAAGKLWLLTEAGVSRTDDGGATWHARATGPGTIVPSLVDPAVAWLVSLDRVLLTRDAGITWRAVTGLPPSPGPGVFGFLPPIVLAAMPGGAASACVAESLAIWCSQDGGPFALDFARVGASRSSIDRFQVDPLVPRRAVAIVGSLVWETTDGSVSWHLLAAPLDVYSSLAITPAGTFLAGRRHVIQLPRAGGGLRVRSGPRAAALVADPVAGTVYAGTPGHLWRASADGRFRRVRGAGLQGGFLPVSVGGRGRTVLAAHDDRWVVSTDSGRTFRKMTRPRGFIFAFAAPHARGHLIASTQKGLQVSRDAGATWRPATNVATIALAADPGRAGRWFSLWHRHLQVSTDDGATWRPFRVAAPTHPGSIVCCVLAASPGRLWWLSVPSLFFDRPAPVAIYSRRLG